MNAYLIGHTKLTDLDFESYLEHEGIDFTSDAANDLYELVEIAGRVCYMSWEHGRPANVNETRNETYIKHILKVDHGSVLEHVTFNFLFTGIDRMVSHELVRHRVGTAFSQLSTRYVDQFERVSRPFAVRKELNDSRVVADYLDNARTVYRRVISDLQAEGVEGKKAREIAATLLPGAVQTQMVFSVNLRELRHILTMRCGLAANAAIRDLFMEVYRITSQSWPLFFCDFEVYRDGPIKYLQKKELI